MKVFGHAPGMKSSSFILHASSLLANTFCRQQLRAAELKLARMPVGRGWRGLALRMSWKPERPHPLATAIRADAWSKPTGAPPSRRLDRRLPAAVSRGGGRMPPFQPAGCRRSRSLTLSDKLSKSAYLNVPAQEP